MRITQEHADRLVRDGFVVVQKFLAPAELSAARQNMLRYVPTAEELAATPERYAFVFDDPEHLQTEFPFAGDALNDVTTHPDLIDFVRRVLGTEDVRLSQSAIWAKYAGTGDFEQGLHLDYQGNTLVVPRDDGDYRQVNMILYYSDVTEALAPTFVVPQHKTRDLPLWPTHRTRKKDPELYRQERPVLANAGDLLVFGMRTWHRASAMTAEFGMRLSHHLVWRSGAHDFQGYHLWSRLGENHELQRFVERATPEQREVLGFPKASDPYWNEETLSAVALRYPRMDLTPYRERGGGQRTRGRRKKQKV
ncbi:MAG TPA: phytanoyl-CoA dioxygenase family protein [Tepidisphaeraceae bacterium]|nr:phytanoyl-CoA dioxygenase family protein [Tepidisphaeraceae bacterium]